MFPLCPLSVYSCPFYGVTPKRHKPSQTARHTNPVLLRGLCDASLCHGLDVN